VSADATHLVDYARRRRASIRVLLSWGNAAGTPTNSRNPRSIKTWPSQLLASPTSKRWQSAQRRCSPARRQDPV